MQQYVQKSYFEMLNKLQKELCNISGNAEMWRKQDKANAITFLPLDGVLASFLQTSL